MNIEKKYKLQTQKLERAKGQIVYLQSEIDKNKHDSNKATDLIIELSSMQAEWELLIEDLRKKQAEYNVLITQLRTLNRHTK